VTPLVWLIATLATYRLTMLIVADELTEPWRERLLDRYIHPTHELTTLPSRERPEDSAFPYSAECRCGMRWSGNEWADVMAEANGHVNAHRGEQTTGPRWLILLDCPWCASVHIGMIVAWSAWAWGNRWWWVIPAVGLASSAVTGFLATYASPGGSQRR
jgi:hypothetical protein